MMQECVAPNMVYFYCHGPFDTGIMLPTVTSRRLADRALEDASKTAKNLTQCTGLSWEPEGDTNIATGEAAGAYGLPNALGFLRVDILSLLGDHELCIPRTSGPDGDALRCTIDTATLYIHRFRTGILSFRVCLPCELWLDLEALQTIRLFLQRRANVDPIFGALIVGLNRRLRTELAGIQALEFSSELLDFAPITSERSTLYWTHAIVVALAPAEQVMGTANYLGRVLTNNNPNDVRNCVSSRPNTFAFVDSGNSLVCVASDLGHVEAYSWVRLIEMRNHVYKVVWDLDHVLYRALNEIAHDASGSSMRRLATLEKTINELRWLSVHLELMLDGFEPRHVTTDFGRMHFIDCIDEHWRLNELVDDVSKKFKLLEEASRHVLDSLQKLRQSRINFVLTVITLLTVISVVADGLGVIDLERKIGPSIRLGLLIGIPLLFAMICVLLVKISGRTRSVR
jgi:hypothetical protein